MAFRFIDTAKGPLVLLFYDGFEWRAREGAISRAKALARKLARYAYRSLRGTQVYTGYYASFRALCMGLERLGYAVRVNDFATARAYPHYPVGLAGYPSVLAAVLLPNPVVFGPGHFGEPAEAGELAKEPRIRFLIRAGNWLRDIYRPFCGDKVVTWPSPVDTDYWAPEPGVSKQFDVLIYDKIYHRRDTLVPLIRGKLEAHLDRLGLSWTALKYGEHHYRDYSAALAGSRSMAFLSHHETQGRAPLEALSSGVPVFAWDEGECTDASLSDLIPEGVRVTSVPYFDDRCGLRFTSQDVEERFNLFWNSLATYRPRELVLESFTLEARAKAYLELYEAAGGAG